MRDRPCAMIGVCVWTDSHNNNKQQHQRQRRHSHTFNHMHTPLPAPTPSAFVARHSAPASNAQARSRCFLSRFLQQQILMTVRMMMMMTRAVVAVTKTKGKTHGQGRPQQERGCLRRRMMLLIPRPFEDSVALFDTLRGREKDAETVKRKQATFSAFISCYFHLFFTHHTKLT